MIDSFSTSMIKRPSPSRACRLGAALLCLSFFSSFQLLANTITVNTKKDGFADDGLCTLAEAIATANNNAAVDTTSCAVGSGSDTIVFMVPNGSILVNDTLSITESLTIKGPGPERLTLRAGSARPLFLVDSGGNAQTIDVSGLTISGGKSSAASGGAVSVIGDTLTLSNCVISGNSAQAGGAVFNSGGTVNITACTISGNTASVTQGGGINNAGTMIIDASTIADNSAADGGGGIFNSGTLTIKNSTISGNSAATSGGGIYHSAAATLNISNSTISGNGANEYGGGIFTRAALTIDHVTISDNTADKDDNFSGAGGGITIDGSSFTVSVTNSIVADNNAGAGAQGANRDCSGTLSALGTLASGGHNLFGDLSGCTGSVVSDLTATAPLLAALGDNGGVTATQALLAGSPALEAIASGNCQAVDDQRSVARPQDANNDGVANCDIGAYEQSDPDNVDLVLAMDDGINAITTGANITWTLTVRNRGPASATSVVLTNIIPTQTSFVSATPVSCVLQTDSRTVICDLGALAVNASASASIVAKTNSAATILNTATVGSAETEIIAGDNTASEETFVQDANNTPTAVDDAFETVTNVALTTGNVIDNDEDVDGDLLVITAVDAVSAKGGSVIDNGDGTFRYTPAIGFVGSDSFTYTVSDQRGGLSTATVAITVKVPPVKPGVIVFSSDTFSVKENAQVTIKLRRTGGHDGIVSVVIATADGTAISGEDYVAANDTITWQDGDTGDKSFIVVTIDDTVVEPDETVQLSLTNVTGGATLGSPASAVLTIVDDDVGDSRNIIVSGTEKQRSGAGAFDVLLLLFLAMMAGLARDRQAAQ